MRGAVILGLASVLGCGARTDWVGRGEAEDGLDGGVHADGAGSPPCTVDGVRWCGAGCPSLTTSECPGGCTRVLDAETLRPMEVGLCWSDMLSGGRGTEPCVACADGDTCAQRDARRLVCVREGVCAKLALLGAGGACRYADKTPYDGRPLASPAATCPTSLPGAACGGACGPCPTGLPYNSSSRCTGRSATRPFGVCPFLRFSPAESSLMTCAWDGNAPTEHCPKIDYGGSPFLVQAACLVFDTGEGTPLTLASRYGLCVPESVCWETKQKTSGAGVFCLPP